VCTISNDSIETDYNNLQGTLPDELQHLYDLEYVSLRNNNIEGTIPSTLVTLSNIDFFDVRFNQMTGSIPHWIGNWQSLQVLGLSNNNYIGQLPASMSGLTSLKTLALDYNSFSGDVKSLSPLTSIEYLYLTSNQFTGPLDQGIFDNMQNLVELDLQDNSFEAYEFPISLLRFPNLQVLELSMNAITSPFPKASEIRRNKALEYLALFDNGMPGTVPTTISNLVALKQLDLSSNQFTGTIPYQIDQLTNLRYLYLDQNNFVKGKLPDLFSNMPDMKELSLAAIGLNGTFPWWLGGMTQLELLDIRDNDFSGSVPSALWEMSTLTRLLISGNYFEGTIPTKTVPPNLKVLALHENNLVGSAAAFCANNIATMTYDCDKVTCTCCHLGCCNEGVKDACYENLIWIQNLGYTTMIWENNYTRSSYGFSNQILLNGTPPLAPSDDHVDGGFRI
jgi:Leucine-rich repeat (LRR) protein